MRSLAPPPAGGHDGSAFSYTLDPVSEARTYNTDVSEICRMQAGNRPVDVAIGHLNGDAIPDLAVGLSNDNNVAIYLGIGSGALAPASYYAVSGSPAAVVIDDANQDGDMDLLVSAAPGLTIYLGNGSGAFGRPLPPIEIGSLPRNVGRAAVLARVSEPGVRRSVDRARSQVC